MPDERNIFAWDGHGTPRKSDPMAIQRRMAEYAAANDVDVKACVADFNLVGAELPAATEKDRTADELAAFQSHERLAAMTRAGFGLKSIEEDEETGWTESECTDLLAGFWAWSESKKKSMAGSSNSPPIMECPAV